MKKEYKKPAVDMAEVELQQLMVLSENNPQTTVNHDEYNNEFSSRDYYDDWDD